MSESRTTPIGRVLLVDDDTTLTEQFTLCLEDAGYYVASESTAAAGERAAARQPFDVCLLDLSIGSDWGIDSIPRLRQLAPDLRIVMVSANTDVDGAIQAIRAGANDYLVKPCSPEQLLIAVARECEARRLVRRVENLERQVAAETRELTSANPVMQELLRTARDVARTNANVLILGPSGTGKGELSKAIHRWSARGERELVTINCPSLSSELLESELFGHNRGAFTGATQSTVGRVAQADGGTLFLDEVGDFPLEVQPKLLRFIQDKEYERVGDPVTRRADVRIVSATNRDLDAMVAEGRFRQDLLYRLNVIVLRLPGLAERPEDIPTLAQDFVRRFATAYGRPAATLSPAAVDALLAYAWPGNVRELQNIIERAVILARGPRLEREDLSLAAPGSAAAAVTAVTPASTLASATASAVPGSDSGALIGTPITLEALERRHIEAVVASSATLDQAARTLGIDPSTLYRKRRAFGTSRT